MDLSKWNIAPLHKVNKGLSKGSRVRMEGEWRAWSLTRWRTCNKVLRIKSRRLLPLFFLPGPRVSMYGISLLSQIDLMCCEFLRDRGPSTPATPLESTWQVTLSAMNELSAGIFLIIGTWEQVWKRNCWGRSNQSNSSQKSPQLVHTLDSVDKHEVVAHVGLLVEDGRDLDRPRHQLTAWQCQH